MIKLQVIGNLGKDCVTNSVNGKNVINFNVAHTEKFKDKEGTQQTKTIWVECAYWTDRIAIAPYLKKGTQVYTEGTPEIRTYPKNDGTTGYSMSMRVVTVQLLGGNRQDGGGDGPYQQQHANNPNKHSDEPAWNANQAASGPADGITQPIDDLPF